MKKTMKKTTKPKVTIASLQEQVKELEDFKAKAEFRIECFKEDIAILEAENKKYQDGITKLEVLDNELKDGVNDLLKEYNDLEVQYTASDLILTTIEEIVDCGYNFFTAYLTLNEIKSILNSK